MKFAAAYRSLFETLTALLLTLVLNNTDFAFIMTRLYPIYFVANIIFSASTVDFSGGKRRLNLTCACLFLITPCLCFFLFSQNEILFSIFFLLAAISAVESIMFVFCEVQKKYAILIFLLLPRIILVIFLTLAQLEYGEIPVSYLIKMFLFRDVAIGLLGFILVYRFWRDIAFPYKLISIKLDELFYLFISSSYDFILRICVGTLVSPAFLKTFEYALRFPRIAQTGLLLLLRNRIFEDASDFSASSSTPLWKILSIPISALFLIFYHAGLISNIYMIIVTAYLSTNAVPWYISQIRSRAFVTLIISQFFSFTVVILSTAIFSEAYISSFCLAFSLFVFSIVHHLWKCALQSRVLVGRNE